MREAQRIKKHYCGPAISVTETDWIEYGRGRLPSSFTIQRTIWVDKLMPEWRVAIPENTTVWEDDETVWRNINGINLRTLTYLPTGRQVYDNTLPHETAIVFEYELDVYRKTQTLSNGQEE